MKTPEHITRFVGDRLDMIATYLRLLETAEHGSETEARLRRHIAEEIRFVRSAVAPIPFSLVPRTTEAA